MADSPKKSQSQVAAFRDLARQLEADEDEEAFKAKVRKVARAPKPPKAKAPPERN